MAKKPKEDEKEALAGQQAAGADLSQLERMLAFMEQHGLEEIEYEHAGLRVRLKKPATNAHHVAARAVHLPEIVVANLGSPAAAPSREEAAEGARGEDLHVVKSPIVGTFYESSNPGAEAFVKAGDQVTAGQVLCIIEAMKLMNEIESDASGEIVRRYVENGQPVEYGESLFSIRPSRKK